MKLFSQLCLLAVGLSAIQALPLNQSDDILIHVRIIQATLNQAADAYFNLWALNSTQILQLPITQSELVNVQYIEYTDPASNKHTRNPVWGLTIGVPSQFFNDQSFLALEVYDNSTSPATYIGGQIATVAQVKQLPHSYQLELLDQAGNNAGVVDTFWN